MCGVFKKQILPYCSLRRVPLIVDSCFSTHLSTQLKIGWSDKWEMASPYFNVRLFLWIMLSIVSRALTTWMYPPVQCLRLSLCWIGHPVLMALFPLSHRIPPCPPGGGWVSQVRGEGFHSLLLQALEPGSYKFLPTPSSWASSENERIVTWSCLLLFDAPGILGGLRVSRFLRRNEIWPTKWGGQAPSAASLMGVFMGCVFTSLSFLFHSDSFIRPSRWRKWGND